MNYIHAFIGWSMAMILVIDLAEIVIEFDGTSYKGNHKIFGWAIVYSSSAFTVSGVVAFMARKLLKWDTRTIQYIRYSHRGIAMTIWCVAIYNMYLGMELYT
jgi:hypothetical protein